jgi:Ca2+-binding EF-hand superfamily protein
MNRLTKVLAVAAMSAAAFSVPMSYADDVANANHFVKMCDTDKDGMVSKAEAMKMVEKMFDKADTKKMGKLDKKQVEAFLRSLMTDSQG